MQRLVVEKKKNARTSRAAVRAVDNFDPGLLALRRAEAPPHTLDRTHRLTVLPDSRSRPSSGGRWQQQQQQQSVVSLAAQGAADAGASLWRGAGPYMADGTSFRGRCSLAQWECYYPTTLCTANSGGCAQPLTCGHYVLSAALHVY